MNAAEQILRTLVGQSVDTCFANPGTSEMHFVSALDRVTEIRCVLGLAETVVTGAADGYARIAGKPAITLLHTGPGLANGLANLHNAKRGPAPILNIVGDHATYHLALDAPLTSDVAGLAAPMSHYVETFTSAETAATQASAAVGKTLEGAGRVVTMILPADIAWSEGEVGRVAVKPAGRAIDLASIGVAVESLRLGRKAVILLGGSLTPERLAKASRIATATGARLASEVFPTLLAHGAGRPKIDRIPYSPEGMHAFMAGVEDLVLIGAAPPVSFFAYPNVRSEVVPHGCTVHNLAGADDDVDDVLAELERRVQSETATFPQNQASLSERQSGQLDAASLAKVVAAHVPHEAILVDESLTSGLTLHDETASSPAHDWIFTTGGAIGWGLPAAVGAAVAAPDRRVIAFVGDGSAIYSLPALWSMARERLNVTIVILANREYAILKGEYSRMKAATMGARAQSMMTLNDPEISFADLAKSFGVKGVRVVTAEDFDDAFAESLTTQGPTLIEAILAGATPR